MDVEDPFQTSSYKYINLFKCCYSGFYYFVVILDELARPRHTTHAGMLIDHGILITLY